MSSIDKEERLVLDPDAYLVDLLDDWTFRNHIAHPERIKQIVKANPRARRYIIDEVQKAPAQKDGVGVEISVKHGSLKAILMA